MESVEQTKADDVSESAPADSIQDKAKLLKPVPKPDEDELKTNIEVRPPCSSIASLCAAAFCPEEQSSLRAAH